jgi:hypothetical protein
LTYGQTKAANCLTVPRPLLQIRVYTFNTGKLIPDPNWPNPDFKTLFPAQGVTNPHGTAYYASGY